jgi:hypothetical protein
MTTRTDSVVPTNGQKLPVTSKTSPSYDVEGLAVGLFVMGAAVSGSVSPPQLFSAYGTVHVSSSAQALESNDCGPNDPEALKGPGHLLAREGELARYESVVVWGLARRVPGASHPESTWMILWIQVLGGAKISDRP